MTVPRIENHVVIGNVYDKMNTRNPIARALVSGFLSSFDALVDRSGARTCHEVGCGEGNLCARLHARGISVRGSDISTAIVEQARDQYGPVGISFTVRDIYDLDSVEDAAELIVCCEALEHLDKPAEALKSLSSVTRSWCILSVPREPTWSIMNMARGRYWSDWGNTPGHVQRWSSRAFRNLVDQYFEIVEINQPLPWTMLLCRSRLE